jgi:O-antigen/teichoic acid export membrane protein
MSALAALRKLASDSLIYGISGTISRFLSVFLVPIYTRLFSPAEYGVISLTTSFFALMNILILFGLDNSVARWYYDTDDKSDQAESLNTFLWTCFTAAALFGVIIFLFSGRIAAGVFGTSDAAIVLKISSLNLPLTVFTAFTWNLLRMQRRPLLTAIFTLTTSLMTIGLNFLFILGLRTGISGIFLALLITSIVSTIWTLILFSGTITWPRINWRRLGEMLHFSLPLVPGSIAFWVVNLSGAYFVRASRDMHDVGLYQIGATVASGMALLTGAFQMAWGPFAFSIHKEPHANRVYSQTLIAYLAITGVAAMTLALFSREILLIFTTREYAASFWVTAILAYNFVLVGLSYIASIGPGIAKNNYGFGVSMVVSAGLLVGLSLLLVPIYGKEGAAIATFVAQLIVPIAVFWHGHKLYPIPYQFGRSAFIFAVGAAISFISLYLYMTAELTLPISIALKLLTIAAYVVIVAVTFSTEVGTLRGVLFSLLRRRQDAIIK